MYSRHVRQWELFSYLPSISCEVIIAFLLPSTLGAKHCLVPDLQNERKQRTLGAGKWVFCSFLWHRSTGQAFCCITVTRKKGGNWVCSWPCHRLWVTHFLVAWKLTGSPFSRGGSKGAIHCTVYVSDIPIKRRRPVSLSGTTCYQREACRLHCCVYSLSHCAASKSSCILSWRALIISWN